MKASRSHIAVGLWVLAAALMLYGADSWHRRGSLCGFAFGLFVGQMALGFTTWVLSERRDHLRDRSVEHIAEVVAALNQAGETTPRRLH